MSFYTTFRLSASLYMCQRQNSGITCAKKMENMRATERVAQTKRSRLLGGGLREEIRVVVGFFLGWKRWMVYLGKITLRKEGRGCLEGLLCNG